MYSPARKQQRQLSANNSDSWRNSKAPAAGNVYNYRPVTALLSNQGLKNRIVLNFHKWVAHNFTIT